MFQELRCLDSSKMSTGESWIPQKKCIFEASDRGVTTFLESPSYIVWEYDQTFKISEVLS